MKKSSRSWVMVLRVPRWELQIVVTVMRVLGIKFTKAASVLLIHFIFVIGGEGLYVKSWLSYSLT